ncbi:hypothetical protein [Shewanella atlantica]|uniref:Lipoprotein n=1 Tax=Shewanella atlantica TaxID=271099 RepID=A0A431WI19_9GAMM|nr:hypothetical protein [Shewanella atlantica]RTR35010.1 hypothetical protein EKG39_04940 [Shewanella atlantica]
MKKAMLSTLLILTASCSSDKINYANTAKSTPMGTSVSTINTEQQEAISRTKKSGAVKDSLTFSKTYSYRLNDMKFTSNADVLIKGSPVSSLIMSEGGVLKGSFVIITTKEAGQLSSDYRVNKIAKNTYRLTPLKAQANLYALYLNLLNNDNFSRVEIEIDYSPLDNTEKY